MMALLSDWLRDGVTFDWLHRHGTGAGVDVAVLDTGIDASHPALEDCVTRAYHLDADGDSINGHEVPLSESVDTYGHGTGVAGIIHRIAPLATLASVRVLGPDNRGPQDATVEGLRWAIEQGYRVVNMSLACRDERFFRSIYPLCEEAYRLGVHIIASRDKIAVGMPAKFSSVVGVDMRLQGELSEVVFSPHSLVECLALGVNVETLRPGGGYCRQTGPSFATPQVTAICALMLSVWPDLLPCETKGLLARLGGYGEVSGTVDANERILAGDL